MEGTVTSVLLAGIATLLAYLFLFRNAERRRPLPGMPGPRGWPVVGSLFSLGELPHLRLMEMSCTYGNVYQLRLGSQYVVVVNGIRAIKESLLKQSVRFAGRPAFPSMNFTSKYVGIVFDTYDDMWKYQRKIIDSSLKPFTSGPTALEEVVTSAAVDVVNNLTNHGNCGNGKQSDPYDDLYTAVGNVTCFVLFGKRYSHDDDNFKKVLYYSKRFVAAITGKGNIVDYLPWMTFAMRKAFAKVADDLSLITRFVGEQINHHSSHRDGIGSVMDSLIRIRNDSERTEGCALKTKTDVERVLCCLFGAGYENTTSTLYYLILYMIIHPEIQYKVHEEIDRVVSRDRLPTLSDRAKLPYTDAVLQEVIRHASLAPLTVPYSTLKDTDLLGYKIPKDTPIFVNLWSANYDENEWEDPHRFNPDRFLSADGLSVKKSQVAKMVAFGMGKRRCPGEQLAQLQLFLFFAIFMHQCHFEKCEGDNPQLTSVYGLTLRPVPFRVVTKHRGPD
ncbi:cytochrome P450 1A1-like [Saccoglossus kowalevskii]|uniref:Cytochrome P450 1A1-like n=1 Tax=Saccoglossus kowalevskii TaxID=10224 RepID=A0ABM0GZL8_SACKO|nr:PREDICTED: cytochrome P450 1A1-like [Saccoglossus kowalevskii]